MEATQKQSSGAPDEASETSEDTINRVEESPALKRQRDDSDPDDGPDNEPEEKRRAGTFKLNPPTLIHGKAKSAPKEGTEDASSKRKFLRPSILSAPSTVPRSVTAVQSSTSASLVSSISQAPVLGGGLSVSSKNPFLKTEEDEEKDKDVKEPPPNPAEKDEIVVETSNKQEHGEENTFLKMQDTVDKKSNEEPSGFVFGSNMKERVVKNEADSTSTGGAESSEFLFGKNLSDRVKVTNPDASKPSSLQTAPAESVLFHESNKPEVTSSTPGNKLEENAAALFNASNTVVVMPEVEVKTGEEDEKNVLQIQCKLHQYDSSNSKNWVERGRGILRLNDGRSSSADCKFQTRLVMRTNGSLRLILNTKIWATMTVDRASQKAVRISALNESGDIGVYLITATINDAEQLYRAIEYRRLHLKQLEDNAQKQAAASQSEISSSKTSVTSTSSADDTKNDKQTINLVQPDTTTEDKVESVERSGPVDNDEPPGGNCLRTSNVERGESSPTAKTTVLSASTESVQNGKSRKPSFDEKKGTVVSKATSHNGEANN